MEVEMKLSACLQMLIFCLTAACFIGGIRPAQADIPDVPRVKVNVFYGGDFAFAKGLEKADFTVGYGYDLLQLLSQDPAMPNFHFGSEDQSKTVLERYPKPNKRDIFLKHCQQIITGYESPGFPFNVRAHESKQNFLALAARKHADLSLDDETLEAYNSGRFNAGKPLDCIVAKHQGRRDVVLEQKKISFIDLPLRTAKVPVALLTRGKQVYIAFLDYEMRPVDVAEEEHSGRFDNATNLQCYWKQLYIFKLDELITK